MSGYLLQVERVAAADFRGREAELSELASFSTEALTEAGTEDVSERNYWRWLAPAWAGKSALLAEFVLNPPPGIDVAAFFITSRMAGQNDAAAFCEVVQRQLYALLREEEPLSTPATRDEQLRLALDRAAERCATEGRRLVLVVDGLDEDHGVTAGPGCHSIAALLPRTPPHDMRIIVAGRPHPPVPDDVPGDHPLRTTEINHWLAPSPYAQAVRWDAEQNLLRLLDGGGLGRELVGLTVAAGGGLSASDIAELTGSRPRLVERELSAVTGRSFRRRSMHWASHGPEVYLLAHEEIQRSAAELITDAELAACRTRLHRWAQTYRSAGWPATTPEYLLRGYAQLLRELGDTGRLVELVCDPARHERLWQVTGADLEALSELSTSLDQLLAHGRRNKDVDVSAALRLAAARDGLHERAAVLPADLIGLWARLGHTGRAISLAESQRESYNRVSALTAVATCLAATGHRERADALAADADSREDEARFLDAIAEGLAEAGLYSEALRTVARMEGTDRLAKALVATVRRAADDHAAHGRVRAETIMPHLAEAVQAVATVRGVEQGELYADLACAFSLFGDEERAQETIDLAVRDRSDDEGTFRQAQNLGHIAVRLAPAPGLAQRAASIARDAAELADTIDDPRSVEWLFPDVAEGLAATGQYERAEQVARVLPDPADHDEGLCAAARAAAQAGCPGLGAGGCGPSHRSDRPGQRSGRRRKEAGAVRRPGGDRATGPAGSHGDRRSIRPGMAGGFSDQHVGVAPPGGREGAGRGRGGHGDGSRPEPYDAPGQRDRADRRGQGLGGGGRRHRGTPARRLGDGVGRSGGRIRPAAASGRRGGRAARDRPGRPQSDHAVRTARRNPAGGAPLGTPCFPGACGRGFR